MTTLTRRAFGATLAALAAGVLIPRPASARTEGLPYPLLAPPRLALVGRDGAIARQELPAIVYDEQPGTLTIYAGETLFADVTGWLEGTQIEVDVAPRETLVLAGPGVGEPQYLRGCTVDVSFGAGFAARLTF